MHSSALLVDQNIDVQCLGVSKRFSEPRGRELLRAICGEKVTPAAGYQAVSDISLKVERGKFLGILGRNGAGKSTLLRTVGGVFEPTSGVVLLGHEAGGIYELGVSQQPMMTGREYAFRWLSLNGIVAPEIYDLVEEIRDFSELEDYFDKRVGTYSSGMKARLYFGVATAPSAKIFLIDEVLSVGDIYFTAKCWGRLRSKLSEGASGILATHDWPAVLRLCENTMIMAGGRMEAFGPSKDVVRKYLIPPELERGIASFDLPEGLAVKGRTGADFRMEVELDAYLDVDISVGVSVEQFIPSIGWEHIMHLDPVQIGTGRGHHRCCIKIPSLPLPAGTYSLNLFLSAHDRSTGIFSTCDQRGWLSGNEIELVVEDAFGRQGFSLPINWTAR